MSGGLFEQQSDGVRIILHLYLTLLCYRTTFALKSVSKRLHFAVAVGNSCNIVTTCYESKMCDH